MALLATAILLAATAVHSTESQSADDPRTSAQNASGQQSPAHQSSLQQGSKAKKTSTFTADRAPAKIPDIKVMDQDGKPRHFYSDLVRGKVVVINFIYTTCTTICPPLGATFGKLQKNLGERLGKDVFLISVSVDPATDTPERLRAWGAQFKARPGWTLVTGEKAELTGLLRVLGADAASPENHSPMVLIVNDKAALWKRVYGLGSTAALMHNVEEMMAASSGNAGERPQ
ncbi:MAG TPA: SCO family protein [Candidatus Angelobacter sp.]|nr:SCO family protein [Candidatus Angelobacter sp.]